MHEMGFHHLLLVWPYKYKNKSILLVKMIKVIIAMIAILLYISKHAYTSLLCVYTTLQLYTCTQKHVTNFLEKTYYGNNNS